MMWVLPCFKPIQRNLKTAPQRPDTKKNSPVLLEMVSIRCPNQSWFPSFPQGPAHEDTWYHPQQQPRFWCHVFLASGGGCNDLPCEVYRWLIFFQPNANICKQILWHSGEMDKNGHSDVGGRSCINYLSTGAGFLPSTGCWEISKCFEGTT